MTEQTISPLRRRMIEDMTIRQFAPRTQAFYIRTVYAFTVFLGRAPDRAAPAIPACALQSGPELTEMTGPKTKPGLAGARVFPPRPQWAP